MFYDAFQRLFQCAHFDLRAPDKQTYDFQTQLTGDLNFQMHSFIRRVFNAQDKYFI